MKEIDEMNPVYWHSGELPEAMDHYNFERRYCANGAKF